jgi:membrane fusion protein (multidrug efflux system)
MFKYLFLAAALGLAGLTPLHAQTLQITGITEPYLDVTLGLADAGIIRNQYFKEGDRVKQGDVILELDKNLEKLEVQRRKAIMDQDKMIHDSTRELSETTKSVSQEDLIKAESDYEVATADYQIAVQQLADRQLVAPFSGAITEVLLKPGAAVAPYQPLVRLVDVSRCYFVGHIDGTAASQFRLDQPVKIAVEGGQTVEGKVCYISPVVDAASGLARIKVIFDNQGGEIRPGLAARLTAE